MNIFIQIGKEGKKLFHTRQSTIRRKTKTKNPFLKEKVINLSNNDYTMYV